ncbi:hypothetical protein PAMP_012608 [Pampus punctatissimus]
MASSLYFIVLLCGVWFGAHVGECFEDSIDAVDLLEEESDTDSETLLTDDECTCPAGWTQLEGQCFKFYKNEKDWANAERFCTTVGGNLPSIHSAKVYAFLREFVKKTTGEDTYVWLGGYDAVKEGVWLWSDGSKFDFKGWAKGEPNNYGGEDCMGMNFRGKNYVNDAKCNMKKAFVCVKQL